MTIRIGVQWAPAVPGAELHSLCRELEDLGYFSLGFPDHYFVGRDTPPAALFEPFTAMGFVAAATSRLRIVSIVAANDFRHPALFARSVASLDVLSNGRIEAGIGAGWFGPEFKALGSGFDPPGLRISRLEEAIAVAKAFWTQERADFSGEHYRVEGLWGLPRVIQRPHPPLLIGAGGDRILRLAARQADVVGITTSLRSYENRNAMLAEMSHESVGRKVALVRETAEKAGRDPSSLILQTQINTIDFGGEDPGHLWAITGDPESMIDELERRREMGISYHMLRVRDRDLLREFGEKVVAKL